MGVIIYSFRWNVSPKVWCGVLEGGIVKLQSGMLMVL